MCFYTFFARASERYKIFSVKAFNVHIFCHKHFSFEFRFKVIFIPKIRGKEKIFKIKKINIHKAKFIPLDGRVHFMCAEGESLL